jgi:teichuronic acid biosynthesis glycosyltransferase TuaC
MPHPVMTEALSNSLDIGAHNASKGHSLRVLSLSCVYPNPLDARLGVFVQSRLRNLSRWAHVKVIAPIPYIDYSRSRLGRCGIPRLEQDRRIEILHPAWLYPPGGTWFNAILLFMRLFPLAIVLRRRYHYDVIDAHFAFPDGAAAGLLGMAFRQPFVVTLRGNETMHAQHRGRRALMAWSLRRAGAVVALSEELRHLAVSLGVEERRIKVIPNGVDSQIYFPRDRSHCRQKHGIDKDARVVLSAGSLIERKGHHRAMQAAAGLSKAGLNVSLLIAGGPGREGKYESELRKQAANLGASQDISFLGEVAPDDLAELMSAADIFCLASSREGWPNVIHEALACGTPVVATRVGAITEMIPSTEYGLIVPLGEEVALEQALREALLRSWDRDKIAQWAHSRSWEHVAHEVYDVLREVLSPA